MSKKLNRKRAALSCLASVLASCQIVHAQANNFADIIRKTPPRTPEQEKAGFHLPPGFEIDLVVAEPVIAKPINMQFDAKGRLWVTQSKEYPFPAPDTRPAQDALQVLSDFKADGRAGKVTTFATNLNIPIGVYPYRNGALGYSIPNIYHFQDTNGDGIADTKDIFLGKFSYDKDTHGMTSSFRRGFDGFFYANHGFNNTSTLVARDGSTVTMHSGNTYRIHIDGTHLEQFVWGRVNPFGLMFDPLGNLYSSDCETWPIYNLLRGGYYPSFGAPDDGLGFAPPMMDHKHGSTAIAGLVFYAATNFPPEFRNNIFVGNVMTCRIDRDTLEMRGSTGIAREQADFLSCDDPWFRPVDIQLGPDGALYMADFYNRIIGHYEVPLDNPGRDRERGRIWRIRYVGTNGAAPYHAPQHYDLSKASESRLLRELGNSNITIRMLAMSELSDRIGAPAIKGLKKMVHDKKSSVLQRVHGMWTLYRLGALDADIIAAAAHDEDRALRIHAMRVLAETSPWTVEQHGLVVSALEDPDALVERCAADALGQHPAPENMRPLLNARLNAPDDDTHLVYVLRMSLRNQLRLPEVYAALPLAQWNKADDDAVADVSLAVPTAASAQFLLRHLQKAEVSREQQAFMLKHIARYLPESDIAAMADLVHEKFANDVDLQLALFKSMRESLEQRGTALPERMRQWGADVASTLLNAAPENVPAWQNIAIPGNDPANPWTIQTKVSQDGRKAEYITSLPNEPGTGILRSRTFDIPAQLTFFVSGHDGVPDKPAYGKNLVRLREAGSGKILKSVPPPRDDTAHKITWNLSEFAGQKGYLEIVDGDTDGAYAWIAVGRIQPEVVPFPLASPNATDERIREATDLAGALHLDSVEEPLTKLLSDTTVSFEARYAAAKALATIHPEKHVAELAAILANGSESSALREQCANTIAAANTPEARTALITALPIAPLTLQTKIALALASSPEGAEALLQAVADGKGSARLLQDRNVKERLEAAKPADVDTRIAALTKGLPAADAERQKIINERVEAFSLPDASPMLGEAIFKKNCMVCHAIAGQGASVGPNLDGIGNRGVPRVMEDILDPSRNVDRAFRVTLFKLTDGDVQSGLFRREEGEMLIVAQPNGQDLSIPKKDVVSRRESDLSLMPDNFYQVLSHKDFNDLVAFLITKNTKK